MNQHVTAHRPGQNTAPVDLFRILFLHPKTLVDSWPIPVDTLGEIIKFPSAVYPILAAAIKHLPVSISFFDGYVARETFEQYKRRLQCPDVIAITCMSPLKAMDTELTIRLAKQLNPKVRIVVGGNHATAWPERWLQVGVDFVVVGEGEIPFRLLIEALITNRLNFETIPNLYWKEQGKICRSTIPLPQLDLNETPIPEWQHFDFRPYGLICETGHAATVEVSRGCPHRCDFCNINKFWNYKQRYKSVERVIAELKQLKTLGIREFIFTDDNFGGDERHTIRLLEAMVQAGLGMKFGCFLRGDTVSRNPQFAKLAAAAGMRFCMMGIENLDPTWLKQHRKGVRSKDPIEMYARVYRELNANNIFLVGLFITPPHDERGHFTSKGVAGVVCDCQLSADLLAQKGSALYDRFQQSEKVAKDMFYHDWNMTSILLDNNKLQKAQKSLLDILRLHFSFFALKTALLGSPVARKFRWRPIGVFIERMLCTTVSDVKRWNIARRRQLSLQERQDLILKTVLASPVVDRALRSKRWLCPLRLRTGLWSR